MCTLQEGQRAAQLEKLLVLRRANELLRRDDEQPKTAAREQGRLAERDADTYHTALMPPNDGVSLLCK